MPAIVQSVLWVAHPVRFAEACRRRYGNLFTVRMYPFGPIVYVADPEHIRRILTSGTDLYCASEANKIVDFVVGPCSLLLLDGVHHASRRRTLMPPFHGDSITPYRKLIGSIVTDEVRRWPQGTPVRLHHRLQRITLDVMIQAVFGITGEAEMADLRRLVPELLHVNAAIIFFPRLRKDLGSWSPWGRFVRARNRIDEVLYAEIARRRHEFEDADRKDVLSLLLRAQHQSDVHLSDAELRDHLVTLLAVGHETTATALAWVIERLARHPGALARVRTELELPKSPYLEAVINETLRIRPVTMDIARVVSDTAEIGQYRFSAGTMVALSLGLLHSSPSCYPEPARFAPERFLDSPPPPYHFLPFGGGTHRCLGAHFAMMEMKVILQEIVRLLDIRPSRPQDEAMRAAGPMLVPARHTEVILEPRESVIGRTPGDGS